MNFVYRFVTPDLHVVCPSVKDYNSYQDLQEIELMELNKTVNKYQAEQKRRVHNYITIIIMYKYYY